EVNRNNRLTNDFLKHSELHNPIFKSAFKILSKIIVNAINNKNDPNVLASMKNSITNFLQLFPVASGEDRGDENDDSDDESFADITESYSLLIALLKYEKI